ncbi:MAG: hypothetical protein AB1635_19370 [Acidobacteriota bacterium]
MLDSTAMQRHLRFLIVLVAMAGAAAAGCRGDEEPPQVTAAVSLSRATVPLGAPVEVTYRFTLVDGAPPLGPRKVFAHFLDADEELMWTDDHEPPVPTTEWVAGQPVEYTRTMFVPVYPYIGAAKVVVGIYDAATNARVKLSNRDRGDRSYEVAQFELRPQTENVFVIFKDGWHPAEVAPENPAVEWQWTRKEATLAFRNPKQAATLFLQVDNPSAAASAAQQVDVRIGETVVATIPVGPNEAPIRKIAVPADALGTGDMVEIRLVADRTFVPALEPNARSNDTRELGVRVFHAFVQVNEGR